ncbi:MAG: MiaB/RimO family radical SAM methylthiotransferase, partial [Eggerthellaceae bacterium]|nr:MiaB/RimO family radical SAM methylthiotransferase [Eggerthellaceae bacterium]
VVVVNTCTVTGEAQKKTRKTVRHVLRQHPAALVVVTGCAAAIDPDEFTEMSSRVRVVAKPAVADMVAAMDDSAIHGNLADLRPLRMGDEYPTRVGVKIQDGCDNACTFCIVHIARGKSRSREPSECIEEVRRLHDAGAREIVLTGIDLGNYRFDDVVLPDLIGLMIDVAPQARFRISSIEPPSVTERLVAIMGEQDGRICRHLHIPLQSGSGKVLFEMNRRYSEGDYADLVASLYRAMPQMSISTDIIVGFPGETEEDFQQTLDMVRLCRFSKVHAFRYSKRSGTPAAIRADQVAPEVAAERAARLAQVADEVRRCEQEKRIGTTERVLVEQEGLATTESYFTARVPKTFPRGALVSCTLTDLDKDGIFSV